MANSSSRDFLHTPTLVLENTTTSNHSNASESDCRVPAQATAAEFYLVAVFGTTVAVISILENILLFYLLVSRPKFRTSGLFYLTFLAFFDIFVGACYITMLTVQVMKDYFRSTVLSAVWHFYLRPMMALSQSTMTASAYLIVAATFERFLSTVHINSTFFNRRRRTIAAIIAILGGFITKGAVFWELKVIRKDHCQGMARYEATLSDLVYIELYEIVWRFWARNILTIFLPFTALAYMNVAIVRSLRRLTRRPSHPAAVAMVSVGLGGPEYAESKVKIRRATRMLASVVTTYLVTNLLNLVLTVWEHVDADSLLTPTFFRLYSYGVDMVSILVVFCCAVRLPIYCWCNSEIWEEVCAFFGGRRKRCFQEKLLQDLKEDACEMRRLEVAEQTIPLFSEYERLEENGINYHSLKQNGPNLLAIVVEQDKESKTTNLSANVVEVTV